jgi:hypothetical protein
MDYYPASQNSELGSPYDSLARVSSQAKKKLIQTALCSLLVDVRPVHVIETTVSLDFRQGCNTGEDLAF